MNGKLLRGIGAAILSATVAATSFTAFAASPAAEKAAAAVKPAAAAEKAAAAVKPAAAADYDYGTALRDSIIFYDANKCGPNAGVDNFFDWRGPCHTEDGADVGLDLTGGYHDCGDHVKFGLTQCYSASVLEWEFYRYKPVFDRTGNTPKMLEQLKYFTDYFLKCHSDPDTFYYQIGDGTVDHTYWGPPEDQTDDRPTMFKADPTHPAADVVGEASAALSLMYLNYKDTDADYSAKCLTAAKELYNMGKAHPGLSDAQGFYSSTTYKDDMAWAATWLYTITNDEVYLDDATADLLDAGSGLPLVDKWTMCWDDMFIPAEIRMYELTGNTIYSDALHGNIDFWENSCETTPGGLKYLTGWGVLRYSAAESMVAMAYYEDTGDASAESLAKSQINYILGDNPENISYMIGFGDAWPQHPHHRAANGYTYIDNGNLKPAKHLLLGGLIGGPDSDDVFDDDGSQYQYTETGIDYDAGFVGALAALEGAYGPTAPTLDSVVTPGNVTFDKYVPEDIVIPTEFNGNKLDNIVNDALRLIPGTDYTVTDDSIIISKSYFAAQDDGDIRLTFLFSGGKMPSITFTVKDSSPGGSSTSGTLEVQMFNDSTAPSVNGIVPRIRLINKGNHTINLSDVTLRYYYTRDSALDESIWCDWATAGSGNVTGKFVRLAAPVDGADSYVEIGFTPAAGTLGAGSSTDIQMRFSHSDWSDYDQSNDYSFNPTGTTYADWTKMTGYVDGTLQWGLEPAGSTGEQDSSISPTSAAFDRNPANAADIPVAVTLNGNTLEGVYNGTAALVPGTDYTVADDGTVTIAAAYLATLPVGTVDLTFGFSAGQAAVLAVAVSDSSVVTPPITPGQIEVQMFNGNTSPSTNGITPRIRVVNTSDDPIALSNVTLHYYFTSEGANSENFWCDWSTAGSGNVTGTFLKPAAKTGADTCLEIGFLPAAGTLAPGAAVEVQARFAKTDWSAYNQADDYSFDPTDSAYADWQKLTAYIGGALAWGTEP